MNVNSFDRMSVDSRNIVEVQVTMTKFDKCRTVLQNIQLTELTMSNCFAFVESNCRLFKSNRKKVYSRRYAIIEILKG